MKLNHILLAAFMELRRIYNDKRRILILVLGPIIISLIFGYVFYDKPKDIAVTVFVDEFYNPTPTAYSETDQIIDAIDSSDWFAVTRVYALNEAYTKLDNGETRAVIILNEGDTSLQSIRIIMDVTDRIINQVIRTGLYPILESYSKRSAIEYLAYSGVPPGQATEIVNPVDIDARTNEWREIKYFDIGASGVIALFMMGICIFMSVTSITYERTIGTIERVYASPYKASEIVLSKLLAYSVLALIVAFVVIAAMKVFFNIIVGNVLLVFLITILIGVNAVGLGILVSALCNSDLAAINGGTLVWVHGILLMGFVWPLESMHPVITYVSRVLPFTYGLHALRRVNLNNWDFNLVWVDMAILAGFTLVQMILAIRFLRRRIG